MERFFMGRASAVTYLLEQRRTWFTQIQAAASGSVETELKEIERIDRLVLDVRAGRVHSFELTRPNPVQIFITD
jgi:hypothetical protein